MAMELMSRTKTAVDVIRSKLKFTTKLRSTIDANIAAAEAVSEFEAENLVDAAGVVKAELDSLKTLLDAMTSQLKEDARLGGVVKVSDKGSTSYRPVTGTLFEYKLSAFNQSTVNVDYLRAYIKENGLNEADFFTTQRVERGVVSAK